MANASNTSPAKPLHRITRGDVVVSIFPGPRVVPQRRFVDQQRNNGYAGSFRVEHLEALRLVLAEAEQWCEEHAVSAVEGE